MKNLSKDLKEIYQYLLASIIVIGIFWLFAELLTAKIPAANIKLLDMLTGALLTAFTLIVGYFFGSSMGSKSKTEMLSKPKEIDEKDMT